MGTRFIATQESLAVQGYRQMVVNASMDDVVLTRALTGLPASWLRGSLDAAGLDLTQLPEHLSPEEARERFGADASGAEPSRWADIWSAGHSCSGRARRAVRRRAGGSTAHRIRTARALTAGLTP